MSFQAMSWAVRQKVGNATGKAILIMLANYCDHEGACFPSQQRLADECECGLRTITRWLDQFEKDGLLVRERRSREDGSRTSDMIRLLPTRQSGALEGQHATKSYPTRQSGVAEPIREPITKDISKGRDRKSEEGLFEYAVWSDYPKHKDMSRKAALNEWFKLSTDDQKRCADGVMKFSMRFDAEVAASGKPREDKIRFVKHLERWIKARMWEQELEDAATHG